MFMSMQQVTPPRNCSMALRTAQWWPQRSSCGPVEPVDGVGEGIEGGVAPLDQADVVAQALEEILIEMGVGVDQPRNHGAAAPVNSIRTAVQLGGEVPYLDDPITLYPNVDVSLNPVRIANNIAGMLDDQRKAPHVAVERER